MQFFFEVLIGGLLAGVMYSLVALGFVLIYRASGVFNFAQGAMVFFAALTTVGFISMGAPFWLAVALALLAMVALAFFTERVVLRPLVNQPQITLFMATIGLSFFIEGIAQLTWGAQVHALDLGIADEPIEWLMDKTGMNVSKFDLVASGIAAALVAVLAMFFNKTRTGRALRAVADDHQAALAVGISLRRIWVIVWTVAGFVALVTGLLWGARNGVQFALTFLALKALPVLILGGFESIAGAIVGGLIVGASEKLAEVYIGPHVAGGIDFNYWFSGVLIPFLIFSLAALGLNILTGYAGQLSLGTAAFMAVGAFAAYNFELRVPGMPMLVSFVLAGVVAALIGIVFGLPSLRIKGFYLAVATLAAQFFVVWALTKFGWLSNYSSSGVITAQKLVVFGYAVDTPVKRYLLVLAIVSVMALAAKNMVRSSIGRAWMAVRDMDVAAEVIGIPMMKTKLLAFAISSFYCGVAGALYAFAYLGTVEPDGFNLDLSFRLLFMIIIGGVGSILGSFLGAAFIVLLPIFMDLSATSIERSFGLALPAGLVSNLTLILFGALIIFFLVVEPLGLARLWQIAKEKLRLWPFPH